jgi:hypothetical protein
VRALPSLLVGLGGVGLALLWFYVAKPLAVAPPVVAFVLGFCGDQMTRRTLAHDKPVAATKWVYGWSLVPLSFAIGAAGAVIVIAVSLNPDSGSNTRKEIVSAAVAAVGAFLVAAFVESAGDADENWIGGRFKKRLQERYKDSFRRDANEPASEAELAVKEDAVLGFQGWGRDARKKRAQILADWLATPPPVVERPAAESGTSTKT